MKPLHEQIKDLDAKIVGLEEKLNRILDILMPAPQPQVDGKTPEELKADIINTVNQAFKDVGVETPVVDATLVQDVTPV